MDRDPQIEAHITSVAARTEGETDGLVSAAVRECWPGGAADRTEPWALEWVRRWGPSRSVARVLQCSCAQGRCAVCN